MFNKTRKAFVQIGVFGVNVAWGFLEEITENITHQSILKFPIKLKD